MILVCLGLSGHVCAQAVPLNDAEIRAQFNVMTTHMNAMDVQMAQMMACNRNSQIWNGTACVNAQTVHGADCTGVTAFNVCPRGECALQLTNGNGFSYMAPPSTWRDGDVYVMKMVKTQAYYSAQCHDGKISGSYVSN